MNLTIVMLSLTTSSSLTLFFIIFLDLFAAAVLHPLLLSTVTYIIMLVIVFSTGGIVDIFTFNQPNIISLAMGLFAIELNAALSISAISAWFLHHASDTGATLNIILLISTILG
jgi:hypothetical protein